MRQEQTIAFGSFRLEMPPRHLWRGDHLMSFTRRPRPSNRAPGESKHRLYGT